MIFTTRLGALFLSMASCFVVLGGCDSSDDTAAAGTDTTKSASCSDVCSKVTQLCGSPPPDCETACASFSEALKSCVVEASSCQAADACGQTPTPTPDSGAPPSSDPCAKCTADQFCVTSSSVASEVGCYTPPDSCNGSTSSICPCMFTKGSGPCSKGTSNCSEGAANTISCN